MRRSAVVRRRGARCRQHQQCWATGGGRRCVCAADSLVVEPDLARALDDGGLATLEAIRGRLLAAVATGAVALACQLARAGARTTPEPLVLEQWRTRVSKPPRSMKGA